MTDDLKRVTGIGGIFFKAHDQQSLAGWYKRHLGIPVEEGGHALFPWREDGEPERQGSTVWAVFPEDTTYFAPSTAPFMLNFRVADRWAPRRSPCGRRAGGRPGRRLWVRPLRLDHGPRRQSH